MNLASVVIGVGAALAAAVSAGALGSPSLFGYDRTLPLGVEIVSTRHEGAVLVRDVTFAVDRTTREEAYLLTPAGSGPHPAIVFDPGRWQTRGFFLSEALADARRGVASISLDNLSIGYPRFTSADRATLVERVVAVRRGIDLLLAQPGIDRRRVAFVGHSDGAEMGGIVAGVDRRMRAYVLMSGGGVWDRSSSAAYNALIAPLDADNYVSRAEPAALFFQNALSDQYIPRSDALEYQRLGSRPKLARWYAADHMLDARAERDRQAWLARELGFRAP